MSSFRQDQAEGLLHSCRRLWERGEFIDIKIVTSTKSVFRCHSVVLAAASRLVKSALEETFCNTEEDALIVIPDAADSTIAQILRGLYGCADRPVSGETEEWLKCLGIDVLPERIEEDLLLGMGSVLENPVSFSLLHIKDRDEDHKDNNLLVTEKYKLKRRREQLALSSQRPQHSCCDCGKSFSSRFRLDLHRQQAHRAPRPPPQDLSCDLCCGAYTAPTRAALETHKRNHRGEKPFQCEHCPKAFAGESYLINHLNVHNARKAYKCDDCNKDFQSAPSLAQHRQMHANIDSHQLGVGEPLYVCEPCGGKVFKTKRYLYQHTRRKHGGGGQGEGKANGGTGKHECPTCHKFLSSRAELKVHARVHTGEKPYVCRLCPPGDPPRRFRFRSTLSTHVRGAHRGDRPHECRFCGRAFVKEADLRKHVRTHTRERPYSCTQCEKCFARSDYLRKHMVKVHKSSAVGSGCKTIVHALINDNDSGGVTETSTPAEPQLEIGVGAEDMTSLLGDEILSEAVSLDTLETGEAIQMVLENEDEMPGKEYMEVRTSCFTSLTSSTSIGPASSDWLKIQQAGQSPSVWGESIQARRKSKEK